MTDVTPKKTNSKKRATKKVTPPEQMFLLKRNNEYYLLPASVLNSLSVEEIYRLGMTVYIEQRRQLMQDAVLGDHYVDDIKVVDGLELSLRKIEEILPNLVEQIAQMDLTTTSIKAGKC